MPYNGFTPPANWDSSSQQIITTPSVMNYGNSYTDVNGDSLEGLLKEIYMPVLNDLTFYDTSFTALIQANATNIDYKGKRINKGIKLQRSGGFGAIKEGGNFVNSSQPKGVQGWESIVFLNAYLEVTNPSLKVARDGNASYYDVTSEPFEDTMKKAAMDLERQLLGDGTGAVGTITFAELTTNNTISAGGSAEAVVTSGMGYFKTAFFQPGMEMDFWTGSAGGTQVGADAVFVVEDVDPDNDKITVKNYGSNATDLAEATTIYVTVRGNHDGTFLNEINGIRQLVSDTGYVWNIDRSKLPRLKSIVKNGGGNELEEMMLLRYLNELKFLRGATPNLLMCGPRLVEGYFNSNKEDRRFTTIDLMNWVGGYQGMGIQLGTTRLMLTEIGSCPADELYMLNTNDFRFATMSNGWEWLLGGGRTFQQSHTKDTSFATAVNYLNLVCEEPQNQLKATNIAYPTTY